MRVFGMSTLVLIGCICSGLADASSNGVINFTGEIIAGGCDVVPGSDYLTVNLGTLSQKSFKGVGSTMGAARFDVALTNCHPELVSVGLVFDGMPSAEDTSILALQGENSAVGVGIALYEMDGTTPVPLQTPSEMKVLDGEASTVLRYVVKYKATAEMVTPGSANATANFTLVYN
jgi:major type 1 subunit fimbrin (pilin)